MRMIVKADENPCLAAARSQGWNWDEFRSNDHDGYLAVLSQTIDEQKNECAYTGLWLGEGTSQKCHIDHFRKKSIYAELTLVYSNLFAAAKDLSYGSDYKDKSIHGPRANSDQQYALFCSPLDERLIGSFWYRRDGFIEPMEGLSEENKLLVQNTIDMFNLNHPDLKSRRCGVLKILEPLSDYDEDMVRLCMQQAGFSAVVDFELAYR